MEFKEYITKYSKRITEIEKLFNKYRLILSYDRLDNEKKVEQELLYFEDDEDEEIDIFVFGFNFFIKELEEQEFKKVIGHNSINFKIYGAYYKLKQVQKKIKISDVLNQIRNRRKDSSVIHKYLNRILTLAYYLNWNLEKDKKDLEGDSFIEISDKYLLKLKQRFDFDVLMAVYENEDLFIFVNRHGKLNLVFKDKDEFTKKDIEKIIVPILKKVFDIKKIIVKN